MSNSKKTPWFPVSVKPVHVGQYDAKFSDGSGGRRRWNGSHWEFVDPQGRRSIFGGDSADRWRGLANKPSAACAICAAREALEQTK